MNTNKLDPDDARDIHNADRIIEKQDTMNTKHITWNTGRTYSSRGQRMAAIVVNPNGVLVADYDRGIEYFLPDCQLDSNEIMRRYDANERTEYRPKSMEVEAFVALRDWLIITAKNQSDFTDCDQTQGSFNRTV